MFESPHFQEGRLEGTHSFFKFQFQCIFTGSSFGFVHTSFQVFSMQPFICKIDSLSNVVGLGFFLDNEIARLKAQRFEVIAAEEVTIGRRVLVSSLSLWHS